MSSVHPPLHSPGRHVLDFVSLRPGEPDAGQPVTTSEADTAVSVIPRVVLVLAQDGKLDAVDGAQLVDRQTEGYRNEHINSVRKGLWHACPGFRLFSLRRKERQAFSVQLAGHEVYLNHSYSAPLREARFCQAAP